MSIDTERFDIDIKRFIMEIRKRPVLWDLKEEDYANRDLRRKTWEELVTIFIEKEDASAIEKKEYCRQLQRKWKSLRDCYTRELQRRAKIKSGSTAVRRTQYVFYRQLSFLQGVTKIKDTSNNLEDTAAAEEIDQKEDTPAAEEMHMKEDTATAEEISSDDNELLPTASLAVQIEEVGKRKRKKVDDKTLEVQGLVNGLLQACMQKREEQEHLEVDDDRLFLLSLLNPIKKIPEHLRFGVRMEIMQVVHNNLCLSMKMDNCTMKMDE